MFLFVLTQQGTEENTITYFQNAGNVVAQTVMRIRNIQNAENILRKKSGVIAKNFPSQLNAVIPLGG